MIPRFTHPAASRPRSSNKVLELFQAAARASRRKERPGWTDIEELKGLLESHSSERRRVPFDQFCAMRERVKSPVLQRLLSTKVFILLQRHDQTVLVHDLLRHVFGRVVLDEARASLEQCEGFSETGARSGGSIGKAGLEQFVTQLFQGLLALPDVTPEVCSRVAVGILRFFLDPQRTGRYAVDDLLSAPAFDALLEVSYCEKAQDLLAHTGPLGNREPCYPF